MCFTGKWLGFGWDLAEKMAGIWQENGRKMAGKWQENGWDLADALNVMKKEKNFHIATIKWLIVLIPVLIPDCLSNIYLLEVEIYSDHWMKKTLNKYWSINRNVFYFTVLQFYFYTIKIKYKHAA